MRLYEIGALILLSRLSDCLTQFTCFDEREPVDWLIAIKPPYNAPHGDGRDYFFISSRDPKWRRSSCRVDENCGPIYSTTSQVYGKEFLEQKVVLFYNDQPPNRSSVSDSYGHMKGVVAFTVELSGIWMIHSVPQFPREDSFHYPESGFRNGQHFMCVTFPFRELPVIARQLAMAHPYVYSQNIPEEVQRRIPELYKVSINEKQVFKILSNIKVLRSYGGENFTHFTKSAAFGKDIYEDLVAPYLRTDILVDTWISGRGKIHLTCERRYKVYEIEQIGLGGFFWKVTKDHSKWVVTERDCPNSVTCFGDINHLTTQFKRGGGTLCFDNHAVWKLLRGLVVSHQKCEGGETTASCRSENKRPPM